MPSATAAPETPAKRKARRKSELTARLHFVLGGGVRIASLFGTDDDLAVCRRLCRDLANSLGIAFADDDLADWNARRFSPASVDARKVSQREANRSGGVWRRVDFLTVDPLGATEADAAAARLRAEAALGRPGCVLLACREETPEAAELLDMSGMAISARGLASSST